MADAIFTDCHDGLLTITFNRIAKKNAFTHAMYTRLTAIFRDVASKDTVRVVLMTGGEHFSSGNDLADFLESPPQDIDAPVLQFMQVMSACPVPVIAAVDGFAIGIGTTLLLHCDFVYASHNALFKLPFVDLGLVPEFGSSQLIPLLAGHKKAAELLLLGESFNAQTALEIGLVNQLCDSDKLFSTAQETATRLLQKPHTALQKTKALMKREPEPLPERITAEANEFLALLSSEEAKQAFSAFLKR